jgi:hypothetical protein
MAVVDRSGRPGDRDLFALLVDEGVLERGRLVHGRRLLEAVACGLPLVRRDEDLPERLPADVLLVRIAARAPGGLVQVRDPALLVQRAEQRRCGVDDRLQELVLRPQLRLQPLVVEP